MNATHIFCDTLLATQTTHCCYVYLCEACLADHPSMRAGRPDKLEGGPVDDPPEPCDACENEAGPYRTPCCIDFGADDLQRWAEGRWRLRLEGAAEGAVSP